MDDRTWMVQNKSREMVRTKYYLVRHKEKSGRAVVGPLGALSVRKVSPLPVLHQPKAIHNSLEWHKKKEKQSCMFLVLPSRLFE